MNHLLLFRCLLLLACSLLAPSVAEARPQILILASGDSMLPATRIMSDEIGKGLEAGLGGDVDLFVEFLDAVRFPEPAYRALLVQLMETKHGGKRFDLIFALGPPAYDFVAEHRAVDYLQAPVVYLAIRDTTIARQPRLANATGIVSRFDLRETVRLATLLQPDLQNLYVVTGASNFDREWEKVARRELADMPDGLAITYLAGLPLDELMTRLSSTPRESALLYLTMFQDGRGEIFMAPDIAAKLAAVAPVYSIYSTYLDRGIVGGHMDTFERVGSAGAALGVRILKGEPAAAIAPALTMGLNGRL